MLLTAPAAPAEPAAPTAPRRIEPFSRLRERQTEYVGPGREATAPDRVPEVLIGYFGPGDPEHRQYGDLWRAAQLAIGQANRSGGYRGIPFRLVPAWSENPWGTGVKQLARLVFEDRVWAIVGGVDGPTTHLAEQIVVKARLPLVSPVSTDKSVNLTNVPWMFSVAPGDHLLAPLLADEIVARAGPDDFVLIAAADHDSRVLAGELRAQLKLRGAVPSFQHVLRQADPHVAELVAEVMKQPPRALVVLAGPDDSARLVRSFRSQAFAGPIYGGPAMGRRQFLELAGEQAAGAVFPRLYVPPAGAPDGFDYAAAHTYDAVQLLVEAIRQAGLNRARIADALRERSPTQGITGTICWDRAGSNTRCVRLATIRNGEYVSLPDP